MNLADVEISGDVPTTVQPYLEPALRTDDGLLDELRAGVGLASAENLHDQVARFLGFRGTMPGETIELQTLPNPNVKYENPCALRTTTAHGVVRALEAVEKDGSLVIGAFYMMNLLHPDIIARGPADLWTQIGKGVGTKDSDIVERRVVFIDHDPERLPGISASEDERVLGRFAAEQTYIALARLLDPALRSAIGFGDSGNGFHVPLAVEIECGDETDRVVKAFLLAASEIFSTNGVKIDTSVGDQRRLCPAYGTMKRKGDSTIERPHRPTFFWGSATPERLQLGDLKHLAWALCDQIGDKARCADIRALLDPPKDSKVATGKGATRTTSTSPQRSTATGTGLFDQVKALAVREVAATLGLLDGEQVTCPGCREQSGVGFFENGLKCHHDRCSQKGKKGFPERVNADETGGTQIL